MRPWTGGSVSTSCESAPCTRKLEEGVRRSAAARAARCAPHAEAAGVHAIGGEQGDGKLDDDGEIVVAAKEVHRGSGRAERRCGLGEHRERPGRRTPIGDDAEELL